MGIDGHNGFETYINSHSTLKINGFWFVVISPLALNKQGYYTNQLINWDMFKDTEFHDLPKYNFHSFSEYNQGEFNIDSLDVDYQNEVARLKSTFSINPNATFRAYKITSYEYIAYDINFYTIFIFDFDDLFIVPDNTIFSSFTLTTLWLDMGFNYPLVNVPEYSLVESDIVPAGYKYLDSTLNLFSNKFSITIPVVGSTYDRAYGAQSWHGFFKKNGVLYFFRNTHLPVLSIDKSKMTVRYDVYILKNKCCLAQCFGITN